MKRLLFVLALLLAVLPQPGCRRSRPPAQEAAQKWHCPMHPSYVSDRPGECPICGMSLVPVKKPAAAGPAPAGFAPITIDPQRQQLIGLKTATVERAPFSATIRTVGRVTYDETRVHHVHTKYEAYVEGLYANFTGKYVRRGEPLLSLYSPDLLAAEQEYLLAVRSQQAGTGKLDVDLVESVRQKLLLWNISAADIAALERSGKPRRTLELYAPISGYIVNKTAVHGMRVKPEDSLFDIVDLSRMWVLADVYEYELPRIRVGQKGKMTLSYWPDRTWEGQVTYIYPAVDAKTRTIKVRLEVDNPKAELKAEMFANVVLSVEPRQALVVPEDAVLETGTRRIVFVSLGEGRLQPREIQAGDRASRLVEVRSGLAAGEEVAVGASFLVDSESRLQAALQALGAPAPDGGSAGAGRSEAQDAHQGHRGHP
jgi:Cu(I)/Ag(I) efflux system membrane fusion protein